MWFAVPFTVASGLDSGKPCGTAGCQSKQDLLDGIREGLDSVMFATQETEALLSLIDRLTEGRMEDTEHTQLWSSDMRPPVLLQNDR
ncbi:hypothetical protein VZT92_013504 [Zoarces viviparus]|uniref:Uncharacterized protein n=1 Tax=Zoarces viviparus TaxID=48416 RepID=A0AAW1F558_ZOAVI